MAARLETVARKPRAAEPEGTKETRAAKETHELEQGGMTTSEALKLLLKQAREVKEYFSYYVTAKTDIAKLRLRNTLIWFALSALGFVALGGVFITASWFVLSGIAGGLGVLFGDRPWIGNIATGLLATTGLGLGTYYAVAKRMKISRNGTIQRYEERKARLEIEFGHNIDQAAGAASAKKRK